MPSVSRWLPCDRQEFACVKGEHLELADIDSGQYGIIGHPDGNCFFDNYLGLARNAFGSADIG